MARESVKNYKTIKYEKIGGLPFYILFSSPQTHNWSRTAIRDLPRSLRLYSTFGGICGYSFLMISRSASSSLRLVLKVLSEIFLIYLFYSLNRTVRNSIRQ